ncbi:MAG: hypothetical protein KAS71_14240, partial [Bacteroidales bacterium]|nr:hypothetical protein [Bacteroidales bacterium]
QVAPPFGKVGVSRLFALKGLWLVSLLTKAINPLMHKIGKRFPKCGFLRKTSRNHRLQGGNSRWHHL